MYTRTLMSTSALLLGALGITTSFFPQETLAYIGATVETQTVVITQILSALYLGFAFLNWYSRGLFIGGIYQRPLMMGNMLHFAVGSITVIKAALALDSLPLGVTAVAYVVFATWFGLVLFTSPDMGERNKQG